MNKHSDLYFWGFGGGALGSARTLEEAKSAAIEFCADTPSIYYIYIWTGGVKPERGTPVLDLTVRNGQWLSWEDARKQDEEYEKTLPVPEGSMSNDKVMEVLTSFIETSSTALVILAAKGYKGHRKRDVAAVLCAGTIPVPEMFPGSAGCVQYGKAIAEHLLSSKQ